MVFWITFLSVHWCIYENAINIVNIGNKMWCCLTFSLVCTLYVECSDDRKPICYIILITVCQFYWLNASSNIGMLKNQRFTSQLKSQLKLYSQIHQNVIYVLNGICSNWIKTVSMFYIAFDVCEQLLKGSNNVEL